MRPWRRTARSLRLALQVVPWIALLSRAWAGQGSQDPHIGYIYPAGGQQGTTVDVVVGGQYLAGANAVYVSGEGVQGTVVRYIKALSQGVLNDLQDKLSEIATFQRRRAAALEEGDTARAAAIGLAIAVANEEFENLAIKAGLDDPTPRGLAELRARLSNPKRQLNPQIEESVAVRLTISPGARPGERELRLRTAGGVTNPLFFQIGQCREYKEREPNDRTPDSEVMTETVEGIEFPNMGSLPVVLNGQILPGDVDRFRFPAKKGMRLVAAVSAQSLIPYLADAVPGWFQAVLTLYDSKGTEIAYADDFRFRPDPIIYCEIPETGDYVLEIRDAIYRGREDFVYRILVGQLPLLTGIFPLGGRVGEKATVALEGWNLPMGALTLDGADKKPGVIPLSVAGKKWVSNSVLFELDTLPQCLEVEPNNAHAQAQEVKLPVIVNGRIDQPGDTDVFRISGRAGDEVVAEVRARRLGSPLDSVLKVCDANGRQLAYNDDFEDKGSGFTTHHADSYLLFKLPADGTCFVHLGDTQRKGGTAYAYRLRLSAPQPDFELRVTPSIVNIRGGATIPIAVYALRKDGFVGEIKLTLREPSRGFTLSGGWVPAGQESIRLTLTAPASFPAGLAPLRLEGRAMICGAEVCRIAVPAEDMMQAFAYHHLVPSVDGMVAVIGSGGSTPPVKLAGEAPVKLQAGSTARVPLTTPKAPFTEQLRLELDDPPRGLAIKELAPEAEGVAALITVDAKDAKPGLRGNLIFNAFLETPVMGQDGKTQTGTRRTPIGTVQAIPFEVVGPSNVADAGDKPEKK